MKVLALFLPEIRELLDQRNFRGLRGLLRQINPVDLADGWGEFSPQEQAALFRLLARRNAALLFEELEASEQEALLSHVREVDIRQLLSDLEPAETSELARELPPKLVQRLMGLLKKERAGEVQRILSFPPESVGGLMRTRFVPLRPQWSSRQALDEISLRTRLRQIEETYLEQLYVTDEAGRLAGCVPLKTLMVAPRAMHVSELMQRSPHHLLPDMDREEAAKLFRKYKLASAPVVDRERRLLGVLQVREVIEIMGEEAEEDFAKMAGMRAGLLSQPALHIAKVRFPWLIATCLGYFLVGWVVKSFEGTLAQVIGLASFMPLIAAMGGNVGAQTATAVVRGMATGEIRSLGVGEIVGKEILVGALLGGVYGGGAALAAHAIYGSRFGWRFSMVVGSGMFASVTAASIMGSLEPFLFQRLRIDPATATGPLITFFADLVSTVTYLTVATLLFSW